MVSGGGRNIDWTSFNKPKRFQKDDKTTEFIYGPDRARYLKVTDSSRTLYIGKAYERIAEAGKVKHKHFIYAGGQLVAIHVKTEESGQSMPDETRYLHRDALGSIDTITDGQGRIIERMSFAPFGQRRAGDWRADGGIILPALTNRGFTGHEHVDEMGLIHMNGRVYDPELGRFLSADPQVQSPYNSQSYNRYSYVLNNPLKYTDPSGHFFVAIAMIFKAAVAYVAGGLTTVGMSSALAAVVAKGAVIGFGLGMGSSLANGASLGQALVAGLKGAVWGGVTAGITSGIGDFYGVEWSNGFAGEAARSATHGVVHGAISSSRGGSFKAGFMSGAFGSLAGSYGGRLFKGTWLANTSEGRMLVASVVGGTASDLGGGKFANGAVSGAFVHMFNAEVHRPKNSFYDGFNKKFLADFEANYPVEHALFKEYALNIDASLWSGDFRHYELAWRNFDSVARVGSFDMLSMSARDFADAVYGPSNILSLLPGKVGMVFGAYNDAGSVNSSGNLLNIAREASMIGINGPQVINQSTFTGAFGRSYDPRLNSLVR
ncbi:MAG: hypothetical protein JMN25_17635 [gamma proteobacterium endosymbiont of Lamellibrachia anaximandri]|nr:hypothetical protein [gamma proteobacterium endosymbiont of Lamellibrachia anaximandri]